MISDRRLVSRTTRTALAAALVAMMVLGCSRPGGSGPPSVVFILVDTLRADYLPSYGHTRGTTPIIDELAARGALFERVIAPSSWTKTSMASILTSRNPDRHGVRGVDDTLPDDLTTLAAAFAAAGHRTIGINTNPWLERKFGFAAGYETYESRRRPSDPTLRLPFAPAGDVNRSVRAALGDTDRRPFFLYVHYMDVHAPYLPDPEYFDEPPLEVAGQGVMPDAKLEFHYRKFGLDAPGVQERILLLYEAGIAVADAAIGRLLEALEADGWLDNTIVVFTSDHGEAFREHGTTGHGRNLYPEVYEVPLIIVWPGHIPGGTRIAAQVRSIDVAPTVLELAGVSVPASFDGESLLPFDDATRSDLLATCNVGLNDSAPEHDYLALISPDHLYVKERRTNAVEFYDLRADPEAAVNLGAAHTAADAYAELARATGPRRARQGPKAVLDQHTREQLQALGYLPDD